MLYFLLFLALHISASAFDGETTTLADILCPDSDLDFQYHPAYMISRGSDFGQSQDKYLRRSSAIILQAKVKIREALKNRQNLATFFPQLLEFLAKERRQMAFDFKTPYAKEFGARRDIEGHADVSYTYFSGGYLEYGNRILDYLREKLSTLEQDKTQFIQKLYYAEENCLGRRTSVEIEVMDKQDIKKKGLCERFDVNEMPAEFPQELLNKKPQNEEEEIRLFRALRLLREERPDQYFKMRTNALMMNLMRDYPSPVKAGQGDGILKWVGDPRHLKSTYVQMTASFEIQGKMLPIFQYFTWAYRDPENPEEDLLERMQRCSTLMVVHQHEAWIQEAVCDMAGVFEKAILWDGKDLSELKKQLALLRYEMACMPFSRGSAAIAEWLEASIFEAHGLRYEVDPHRMVDLEAYANPLFSDFLKVYNSMVTLHR